MNQQAAAQGHQDHQGSCNPKWSTQCNPGVEEQVVAVVEVEVEVVGVHLQCGAEAPFPCTRLEQHTLEEEAVLPLPLTVSHLFTLSTLWALDTMPTMPTTTIMPTTLLTMPTTPHPL